MPAMKRLIMLLISTVMMSMSLTAADIVTVHGEFTYYGSKTESRADCERNAREPRPLPRNSAPW